MSEPVFTEEQEKRIKELSMQALSETLREMGATLILARTDQARPDDTQAELHPDDALIR